MRAGYSKLYRRLTLRQKLLIFTMSMVIIMASTIGLLIRLIIFPYLVHELEGRGRSIANRLAETTRTLILTGDRVALVALLFNEKHQEKNVSLILVTDAGGHLLAHTRIGVTEERHAGPEQRESALTRTGSALLAGTSESRMTDIIVPVREGLYQIGAIHVRLDRRFIDDALARLSLYHLGFVGLVTLLGLFFGLYLSRAITEPITSLTMLVEQIGKGKSNSHATTGRQTSYPGEPPAGDQIIQLADAFNDMTQRLQLSESELRRSEERYRLLFHGAPNPIFVLDLESLAILDANDMAAAFFCFAREELLRMHFTDLGFKDDASAIVTASMLMARKDLPYMQLPRAPLYRPDGRIAWVNISFSSSDQLGKRNVVVTTYEVTEMIETETKLIQAAKMATLGEMAAGIAHELHQPLNAIKIGSEFLLTMMEQSRKIPEEDLRDVADHMSKEVDRAAGIIQHLREFGRKTYVSGQTLDINKPIRGVFTLLGQQLKAHDIEVVTDLDPALPLILADENRIEQVIINLVNNARDAMEAGRKPGAPAREKVLTVRSALEDGRVTVTVADEGSGISKAVGERIFEPFFTTKEVGKGTGLGLSISYGIVRDYGGTISFESTEGVGTTFKLSFPAASEEELHA